MRYFRPGFPLPAIALLFVCLSFIPLHDAAFAWPLSKPKTNPKLDENIRSMRQKAEGGMMEAQMVLAKWCFNGDILPNDHAEAARWYEMAAKQGNAEAMMALAQMLNEGDGIPKDVRKGCEWYVAAARKGNAEAYRELGRIFENGDGVTADKDKAIRLYEEGAKRGNAESALRLARIYESDSGPGDAEKRDHYMEIASALERDADKESIFLGGLYNQMQIQAQDRSMESRWSPDDHADEWGFDGQIASMASEDPPAKQPYVITEEDRRYDQKLQRKAEQEWSEYLIALGHKPGPRVQRKAEQEWNEHARQTGGMVFIGEPGSGQLDSSSQNKSGQARQPQDELAARRYAQAESQRQAEWQAYIAAQNEQQQKAENQRLMRNLEHSRQELRETLISQGLDPRLADPENREEMLRIARERARQFINE